MTPPSGWHGLFWDAFKRSSNAMLLLDERRCHVEVNGAYLELLGHRRQALIGRPVYEFVVGGPQISADEWRVIIKQDQFDGDRGSVASGRRTGQGPVRRPSRGGHRPPADPRRRHQHRARRPPPERQRRSQPEGPESLTPREREIVSLMALGRNGPEIAADLHLSHNTVRTHARNAMNKLGARSRAQLVAMSLGDPQTIHQAA